MDLTSIRKQQRQRQHVMDFGLNLSIQIVNPSGN